jgi:hypothetical protein
MRRLHMYARVVRFTDVSTERIAEIADRTKSEDGPPAGVDSTGFQLIFDEDQGTAVFIGFFADEEKMKSSAKVLEAMDSGETPGTRASVDAGEIKVEMDA